MSNGLLRQAIRAIKHESTYRTPPRVGQWFKWLSPGLSVKRWLLISALGFFLVGLGLAIWSRQTPIFRISQLIGEILETITRLVPNYVSGPWCCWWGFCSILWSQTRSLNTIQKCSCQRAMRN